jgi:glycylpeptide N-tetradecanoyltransferase
MEDTNKEKIEESNTEILQSLNQMLFKSGQRKGDQVKENYKFWDTQPVPKITSLDTNEVGPLDTENDIEKEKQEPYKLPSNFSWYDVDINNNNDLTKLYEFLRDNYVEDDDHMFRFDYSKEFLKWHLTAPGYLKLWHIAVLQEINGEKKMVGFISGIPVHLIIHGKEVTMVEINFLCVQSNYRSRRLAPVLIKEVTRRTHLQNIWQAVYTAGVLLPKPIAKCTYYHRNLNIQKLLDVKFTYLSPNLNLARAKGIYKLSKDITINARAMEKKDVDGVYKLLKIYLEKFTIRAYYSKEEVAHWLLPRDKVVYSFVVEGDNGEITDFISFYSLPSSVLNHDVHKTLWAAYSFFNIATSVSYKELIKNALILAKNNGFDVYNALNIMDNSSIFTELLFGQGDGSLKYYFYNYQCPTVEPHQLSLVLM